MKNKCINCGKEYEYEPKRGTYKFKYCSTECRHEYLLKDNTSQFRICAYCGKEYWWDNKIKAYGKVGNIVDAKKFCCYECGKAYKYEKIKNTTIKNHGAIGYASKELLKKVQDTKLKKYGSLNNYAKIKETNLKKYGVEFISQVPEIRKKMQIAANNKTAEDWKNRNLKSEATKLAKYGDKHYSNPEKARQTNIEKYGVASYTKTEECKARIKATNLEKYGTETPTQLIQIKQKIKDNWKNKNTDEKQQILDKRKKTNLEKYGVEYSSQSKKVKEKVIATNLKRYGVKAAVQSKEVQNKVKQHNLEKYGVEYAIGSKEVQDKIKQTTKEHYGYERLFQSKEFRKKVEAKRKLTIKSKYGVTSPIQIPGCKEKAIETCTEKYGVPYNCLSENCLNANPNTISKINLAFKEKLDALKIENTLEFCINHQNYDFKCGKLLIEINPTYTHNSTKEVTITNFNIKPKDPYYHYNKTKQATEAGYRCIHIWDWDSEDKIIASLNKKQTVYARKLNIREVSEENCHTFLNTFHFQSTCNGQIVRLGLYMGDELIELMAFGKPRYNKNYEWELLRLCTKAEYKVVGGAEKLFSEFVSKYKPKSIISYCDNSKFTGEVYKRLGMDLLDYGKPTKHWYNIQTKRHITDNLLRQRGYSQLHNDKIHKKGESNEQLMLEAGYLEVYDCGQSVYSKKL